MINVNVSACGSSREGTSATAQEIQENLECASSSQQHLLEGTFRADAGASLGHEHLLPLKLWLLWGSLGCWCLFEMLLL